MASWRRGGEGTDRPVQLIAEHPHRLHQLGRADTEATKVHSVNVTAASSDRNARPTRGML